MCQAHFRGTTYEIFHRAGMAKAWQPTSQENSSAVRLPSDIVYPSILLSAQSLEVGGTNLLSNDVADCVILRLSINAVSKYHLPHFARIST